VSLATAARIVARGRFCAASNADDFLSSFAKSYLPGPASADAKSNNLRITMTFQHKKSGRCPLRMSPVHNKSSTHRMAPITREVLELRCFFSSY
jgi:hypothetical protein